MADQDWKHGGLNHQKYVVLKSCPDCDGEGTAYDPAAFFSGIDPCETCKGHGVIRPQDADAAYFVLRIDGDCDPNARKALACYADSVEAENAGFAKEIREWLEECA